MTNLAKTIHETRVGKSTLRFFRSPLVGADFAWVSFDDLLMCLGFSREERRAFRKMLRGEWGKEVKTVATSEGICTIVPHFMVQGLCSAMIQEGKVSCDFEVAYSKAASDALRVITGHLSGNDLISYLAAAHRRANEEAR